MACKPCYHLNRLDNISTTSKESTVYNIFMTIVSVLLIYVGLQNLTGGYLWMALVVAGGFYMGHVVTMALNETSE